MEPALQRIERGHNMLKSFFLILVALGSSNAFAQYPVGPCVINEQSNVGTYQVFDGYGNYIVSTPDYNQALQTAEQYDQLGYCHGIRINTQPYPNTNPNTYPPLTFCMVRMGRDAFGNRFFRVLDGAGRIVYTSPNYQQAFDVSRTDPRCFQPQLKN